MARDRTRLRLEPLVVFGMPVQGMALVPSTGQHWFVDPNADVFVPKKKWGTGKSEDRPFATLAEALSACNTGDTIFVTGNIREENLICSNLKFDVKVVGVGGQHHPDQPTSAYHPGGAVIRPPASPTATTSLLVVRGRAWEFHNIMFDVPVDAAAIDLKRNALSDVSEYDASHAKIVDCRFTDGDVAIKNDGGASFVRVIGNRFQRLTATSSSAGIKCTSTSVAVPLNWVIEDNEFHNNASHILSSMSYSTIRRNTFGRFTQTLSVDIYNQPSAGQGEYNVIWNNYLSGTYGATAYPAGSNNEWGGNYNSLSGGVTAADPV